MKSSKVHENEWHGWFKTEMSRSLYKLDTFSSWISNETESNSPNQDFQLNNVVNASS